MTDSPNKKPYISAANLTLLVGVVLVIVAVGLQLMRRSANGVQMGTPPPPFEVTTYDGETVQLSDFVGKVVLINFWASWCIPCAQEAPYLNELHADFADAGLVLLGLSHSDVERDARAFIAEHVAIYRNAPDTASRIYQAYGLTGVPESFIIGRDGNLAYFLPGSITSTNYATIRQTIEALLSEGA